MLFYFLLAKVAFLLDLTPHLDEATLKELLELRGASHHTRTRELKYQHKVQRQTLSDLVEFYKPENKDRIEIVYASFTPENSYGGGQDLGFGLHIVKRLRRTLPNGTEKITDINELWPEDRRTGGLFLPDEIRVKTLALPGPRKQADSYKNFLFDSIRIAWGQDNKDLVIARSSVYAPQGELNQMRVGVSAPYSCFECHDLKSELHTEFLKEGETLNPEAIVQDSEFRLPPEEQRGFKAYIEHLKASGREASFIEAAVSDLKQVQRATLVPGLKEALENKILGNDRYFLNADEEILPQHIRPDYYTRQGYYLTHVGGKMYRDAIEDEIEGKYRWWEPKVVLPFSVEYPFKLERIR